jgi:hypothetical protein
LLNDGFADSSFVLTIIKAVPRAMVVKVKIASDWVNRFTLICSDLRAVAKDSRNHLAECRILPDDVLKLRCREIEGVLDAAHSASRLAERALCDRGGQ